MKKIRFFSFRLLLAVGLAIVVFNACEETDGPEKEETKTNTQNNSSSPTLSLTSDNGVTINGVKWATRNVDKPGTFTAKVGDMGMYYRWNSKVGWSNKEPLTASDGKSTWDRYWDQSGVTTWSRANDPCPPGWRMPSRSEFSNLFSSAWVSVGRTGDSMFGVRLGSGSNTVFLPYPGFVASRSVGGTYYLGPEISPHQGHYWTNSTRSESPGQAYIYSPDALTPQSSTSVEQYITKDWAFPCRCVADNSGGSSGGSTGGSTGTNRGTITVWIDKDHGCGIITVTISGVGSKTITSYYSSGTPDCGASGTASFPDLPYGTYSVSATCNNSRWPATNITLSSDCKLVHLN